MMASRRRSRNEIEDEEEFPHSPSTQSNSQSSETTGRQEKRQRTSTRNSGEETESRTEGDVDEGFELATGGESEEEEDEEEIQATQRVRDEYNQRAQERLSEREKPNLGEVIKSIELFNFMCHKRLEINFGDKINFVIGHNGSGKSAILTALTICLGGKATATNRGTSLKSLIKEGENSAQIIIKFLNGGDEPYKPELFGDVIAIERRFSKDGSSGYKIKSKSGHTISTKREDLDEIMDYFNLQVDNPMTVLTQDTARQFLGNSSAQDKYKLFMRGVQLSQLDTDYTMVEAEISTLQMTLENKSGPLNDLKELEREWRTKVRIFERSAEIEENVKNLQNQFAWSQVKEQEIVVANQVEVVERCKAKIELLEKTVESEREAQAKKDVQVETAKDAVHTTQSQSVQLKAAQKAAKEIKDNAEAEIRDLRKTLTDITTAIEKCEENIKLNQQKIAEERALEENGNQRELDQIKLQELDQQINEFTEEIIQFENNRVAKDNEIKVAENEKQKITERLNVSRTRLAAEKNILRDLENAKSNRLSVFHNNMPAVMREIHNQKNRFHELPVGPMGLSVKLLKEEWADICENLFGKALNGFLVTDHHDRELLQSILKKNNWYIPVVVHPNRSDVPVITTKRDLFDYRQGEPDDQYYTVLRILEISDEFVKRQLINQNHIESTILIEQRSEADEVMRRRPLNVRTCFSLNPHKDRFGFKVGGVGGGSGSSIVYPWGGPRRLTSRSFDQQIREAQDTIQECQRLVAQDDSELGSISNTLRILRAELPLLKRKVTLAKTNQQKTMQDADDLRESLNERQPDSGRVLAYQEAIDEAKDEKLQYLNQFRGIEEDLRKRDEDLRPLKQAFRAAGAAVNANEIEIQSTNDALKAVTTERMQITTNIQHYMKSLDTSREALGAAETSLIQDRVALDVRSRSVWLMEQEITDGATRYCPERIPSDQIRGSVKEIKAKIDALKKQMLRMQNEAGQTEEEVRTKYTEVRAQYQAASEEMNSLETLKESLYQSYNQRRARYFHFRTEITVRAKILFVDLLSRRAYSGSLTFDHKKQEIRVKVKPAGQTHHGTKKDPKSLSGGEKSFAQICLLLSVWEAMGSPIRALDEFDVFMDAVNRKTCMKMMIDAATESKGKQFILITPQDMSNVSVGVNVRVHKMQDPERGQGVIELPPA